MGLKEVQSSSSKNSKLTNNTSQVKENDNIIGYFGKNTYKTNDLWDFLENALSFSELKLWKFESCENTSMFLVFFFPTFNLNTMHIFCHSELSTILVTKKKKCLLVIMVIAASVEAPSDSLTTSWLKFLQTSIIPRQTKM